MLSDHCLSLVLPAFHGRAAVFVEEGGVLRIGHLSAGEGEVGEGDGVGGFFVVLAVFCLFVGAAEGEGTAGDADHVGEGDGWGIFYNFKKLR